MDQLRLLTFIGDFLYNSHSSSSGSDIIEPGNKPPGKQNPVPTGLNRCTLLRSMETDFGIVPNPKYTESQERYYDLISLGSGNGMAIPVTTQDTERTGIIVEALSAESKYTLTPAYYDITLKTKLSRDEESAAMLDIIFTSRVFELGLEFGWGGLFDLPGSLTGKGSDAIASSVAKKIPSAEKAMQKDLDKLAALEG